MTGSLGSPTQDTFQHLLTDKHPRGTHHFVGQPFQFIDSTYGQDVPSQHVPCKLSPQFLILRGKWNALIFTLVCPLGRWNIFWSFNNSSSLGSMLQFITVPFEWQCPELDNCCTVQYNNYFLESVLFRPYRF